MKYIRMRNIEASPRRVNTADFYGSYPTLYIVEASRMNYIRMRNIEASPTWVNPADFYGSYATLLGRAGASPTLAR